MKSVFVLQHVAREGEPDEDVKMIGVYSDRQHAQDAMAPLLNKPGFRDYQNGFHVDEYTLNQSSWAEGFGVEGGE